MRLMANQWESAGACINWQTMLTTKQIFSLIKVRYWRAPIIWRKRVALENKGSDSMIALDVEIGISTGLQDNIPARVRMSSVYLCYRSIRPILVGLTSIPKK